MEARRLNHDTILTDDAVAELMAKEASDTAIKYSSMGLEAFRSTKSVLSNPDNDVYWTPVTHVT
jgi:hypothetical protein